VSKGINKRKIDPQTAVVGGGYIIVSKIAAFIITETQGHPYPVNRCTCRVAIAGSRSLPSMF